MSVKRKFSFSSFDPSYGGSQQSQVGYSVGSQSSRRPYMRMKKLTKKDKEVASKAFVKRILDSRIETKNLAIQQVDAFGNISNAPTLGMFPVCPYTSLFPLPLGVTNGTRVGNKVKTRRVILSYVLVPTAYNAVSNPTPTPTIVQMWLGHVRQYSGLLPNSVDLGQLFDTGASSSAPQGTIQDTVQPLNRELWCIKKYWTHKLGYAINPNSGVSTANASFSNNDFEYSVVRRIDITKHCPKSIMFNDSAGSTQGPNLFLFYQAVAANGGLNGAAIEPVRIEYWVNYEYEDA